MQQDGGANKTILITGGAGFIGSEVVRKFLAEEMRVVVYDNFSYGKKEFLPESDNLITVNGDINDTTLVAQTISEHQPDIVCHLAAIHFIPDCNKDPVGTLQTNTVGTESVLLACKDKNIEKVFVASTAAVYPIGDHLYSEDGAEIAPIDVYGLSKLFAEQLSQKFYNETGISTVVLRIFNAVGPRETNPHVIPHIFESLQESNIVPLGNIAPKRDYIHTSDIAQAIFALSSNEVNGFDIFNIGTGMEFSVQEIIDLLQEILGRKITIRQDQERIRKTDRMHLRPDISKLKQVTGWEPQIQIEDALKDVARYYGVESD